MSIFNSILEKLGMKKPEPKEPTPAPTPVAPVAPAAPVKTAPDRPGPPVMTTPPVPPPTVQHYQAVAPTHEIPGHTDTGQPIAPPPPPPPAEMPKEDLVAHLDFLAKTGPIKGLNWRVSINDFMALLGMDHSPQAIKDLAVELGCPEKEMANSYSRNVWTHKALMKKLAENGGNVPANLMD